MTESHKKIILGMVMQSIEDVRRFPPHSSEYQEADAFLKGDFLQNCENAKILPCSAREYFTAAHTFKKTVSGMSFNRVEMLFEMGLPFFCRFRKREARAGLLLPGEYVIIFEKDTHGALTGRKIHAVIVAFDGDYYELRQKEVDD